MAGGLDLTALEARALAYSLDLDVLETELLECCLNLVLARTLGIRISCLLLHRQCLAELRWVCQTWLSR
jgi:hypothetical protein